MALANHTLTKLNCLTIKLEQTPEHEPNHKWDITVNHQNLTMYLRCCILLQFFHVYLGNPHRAYQTMSIHQLTPRTLCTAPQQVENVHDAHKA